MLSRIAAVSAVMVLGLFIASSVLATSTLRDLHTDSGARMSAQVMAQIAGFRLTELGELAINLPKTKLPVFASRFAVPAIGAVVLALLLVGLFRRYKQPGAINVFVLCYGAILFVWPYYDPRFWLGILPFLIAYLVSCAAGCRNRGVRMGVLVHQCIFVAGGLIALIYSTSLTFAGPQFGARYGDGSMKASYCAALQLCAGDVNPSGADPKVAALLKEYR
jgi:hypothetical protein